MNKIALLILILFSEIYIVQADVPMKLEDAIYIYEEKNIEYLPVGTSYGTYNPNMPYEAGDPLSEFHLYAVNQDDQKEALRDEAYSLIRKKDIQVSDRIKERRAKYWHKYLEFFKKNPGTFVRNSISEQQAEESDRAYDQYLLKEIQDEYIQFGDLREDQKYRKAIFRNINKISERISNCDELLKRKIPVTWNDIFNDSPINRFVEGFNKSLESIVSNCHSRNKLTILAEKQELDAKLAKVPMKLEDAIYVYDESIEYLPVGTKYKRYEENSPYAQDDPLLEFRANFRYFYNTSENWQNYIEFYKKNTGTFVRSKYVTEQQALILDKRYDDALLKRAQDSYMKGIVFTEDRKYRKAILRNISKIAHRICNCNELLKRTILEISMDNSFTVRDAIYSFNQDLDDIIEDCEDRQQWGSHDLRMKAGKELLEEVKEDVSKTVDGHVMTFPMKAWYYFKKLFKTVFGIVDDDENKSESAK